jgi:hypothetical protein
MILGVASALMLALFLLGLHVSSALGLIGMALMYLSPIGRCGMCWDRSPGT